MRARRRSDCDAPGFRDSGFTTCRLSARQNTDWPSDSLHTPCLLKPEPVRRRDLGENGATLFSSPPCCSCKLVECFHYTCATVFPPTSSHLHPPSGTLITAGCQGLFGAWWPAVTSYLSSRCSCYFISWEDSHCTWIEIILCHSRCFGKSCLTGLRQTKTLTCEELTQIYKSIYITWFLLSFMIFEGQHACCLTYLYWIGTNGLSERAVSSPPFLWIHVLPTFALCKYCYPKYSLWLHNFKICAPS